MYKENVCDETRLKTTENNLGVWKVLQETLKSKEKCSDDMRHNS